jgi:peptidoglycan/xylan/chitin deacetylase (PgdA/CDA1 family)
MNKYNILVLHKVVRNQAESFIDITQNTFRHILKASLAMGKLATIDEAIKFSDHSERSTCLTFDDGFSSDYQLVLPELKKLQAAATFFIVTDWLEKPGYLTKQQVRELSDAGMQIGSHSKSHPNFLKITPQERLEELSGSKLILENIIGKEISTFSFPYGFYDKSCCDAVFKANYSICCTSQHGLSDSMKTILPRNSINAHTSINRIDKILRASFIQQILWYFEDAIKKNLKHLFPRFYRALRNLISTY